MVVIRRDHSRLQRDRDNLCKKEVWWECVRAVRKRGRKPYSCLAPTDGYSFVSGKDELLFVDSGTLFRCHPSHRAHHRIDGDRTLVGNPWIIRSLGIAETSCCPSSSADTCCPLSFRLHPFRPKLKFRRSRRLQPTLKRTFVGSANLLTPDYILGLAVVSAATQMDAGC
jgi:hypothetical protein